MKGQRVISEPEFSWDLRGFNITLLNSREWSRNDRSILSLYFFIIFILALNFSITFYENFKIH